MIADLFGEEEDDRSEEVRCKYCGKGRLTWKKDGGRWVLLEPSGKIHTCKSKKVELTLDTIL